MTRELAQRTNDGVQVVLLWDTDAPNLTVEVHDARAGADFALTVDAAHGLDAFNHPYAYAAHRGVPYVAGRV